MDSPNPVHNLPVAWMKPRPKARLHILRAHASSRAVIIRRRPSKRVHVISWDSASDSLEYGSWFGGRIYSERSLSEFSSRKDLPFSIERMASGGEVFPILSHRLERDGWKREGGFGRGREISLKHSSYSILCLDDPGWSWQPSSEHPVLRMYYRGYPVHGYTFEFILEGSGLLGPGVDWATWDANEDLLVAREDGIQRYTLVGLKSGSPDFAIDLECLSPPGNGGPAI